MLEQGEEAMKSLPPRPVFHLFKPDTYQMVFPRACMAPLSKASALALCIPCLLSVWSLLVGVVLQGGGIVVRQCEVPFQRGLPDWDPVATLAPPSLLSWSCFVLSLIPPQGCLLWCQLPHLPGGPEEKDQPFPLVLPSR